MSSEAKIKLFLDQIDRTTDDLEMESSLFAEFLQGIRYNLVRGNRDFDNLIEVMANGMIEVTGELLATRGTPCSNCGEQFFDHELNDDVCSSCEDELAAAEEDDEEEETEEAES